MKLILKLYKNITYTLILLAFVKNLVLYLLAINPLNVLYEKLVVQAIEEAVSRNNNNSINKQNDP